MTNTGGGWERARVELDVPGLSIAAGQSYKWFPEIKFGAIDDYDNNAGNATLWTGPEDPVTVQIYPYQSTPFDLEVLSDDAADTETGTGARRMEIQGLDEDFLLRNVFVNLNGLTPVAIPDPAPGKKWLRIIAVVVRAAGTGGLNLGSINIRIPTVLTVMQHLVPRSSRAYSALTTVPADHIAFIKSWQLVAMPEGGVEGGGTGQVPQFVGGLMLRNNAPRINDGYQPLEGDLPPLYTADISAGERRDVIIPILLEPKTDIELRLFNTDLNNSAIAGNFQCVVRRLTPEELNGSEAFRRWIENYRLYIP